MRRCKSKDGSTLIETLVAITVFAATASAAFSMLGMAVRAARENELNAYASSLAVQEREDLRSLVYSAIATRDPFPVNNPQFYKNTAFTVHTDVQDSQPAPNMKTVTVTVAWNYRSLPRTYALQTIYTDFSGAGT
jgi:type II secretory pathway pseudopilin PulG